MENLSFLKMFAEADWLAWGVALLIGLPTLVIVLGEIAQGLQGSRLDHFRRPLDMFRNGALFLLFMMILLRMVVGLPGSHLAVKVVDTAFWIAVLNAVLALTNAVMFEGGIDGREFRAPKLLVDLGRVFLVAIGAALIVSYVWNVDLTGLLAALGVSSLVIGLALQDTLGNIFSGVTMISANAFRVGSWIRLGDIEGQVRAISWRSVSVATVTGDLIEIPNSQIAKDKLRVLGADRGWAKLSVDVKLGYDHPPEFARSVLLSAVKATANVLETPAPSVSIAAYDDAVVYRIVAAVRDFSLTAPVRADVLANVWYAAGRNGIRLAPPPPPDAGAPADHAAASGKSEEHLASILARLGTFQRPREALQQLAEASTLQLWRKGEILIPAGQRGDAAYIVVSGEAEACRGAGAAGESVWSFAAGDLILFKSFFRSGEAPLSVVCTQDLSVVRIPIATLETALANDARLARQIEQLLTAREESGGISGRTPQALGGGASGAEGRVQILKDLFTA